MANEMLRAVAFENLHKMLVMGLDKTPFIRDEDAEKLMIETWLEALEDSNFTDRDAKRISSCWRAMRRTQTKWFTPRQLIESVRTTIKPEALALPNLSEDQRQDNLIRLQSMMKGLKMGGQISARARRNQNRTTA